MKDLMTRARGFWVMMLLLIIALGSCGEAFGQQSLTITSMTVQREQTNAIAVVLNSQGDIARLGFNLEFDTNLLTFVRTTAPLSATDVDSNQVAAPVSLNTDEISDKGRIGFELSLPGGGVFNPGPQTVLQVFFKSAPGVTTITTAVVFADSPLSAQVVTVGSEGVDPTVVPASFANGIVTIQAACSFSLDTNAASFEAVGGNGAIAVTASRNDCAWAVVNSNSWISITAGNAATDSGVVVFSVDPNASSIGRTGVLAIAETSYTITQAGIPVCAYALSPTNRIHGSGAASNAVIIDTAPGCAWTLVNTNEWLDFGPTAAGTGSNSIGYLVSANLTSNSVLAWC